MNDLKDMLSDIVDIKESFESDFIETNSKASEIILENIQNDVPIKTGDLKKSFSIEKLDKYTYDISSDKDYAEKVDLGDSKRKANLYFTKNIEKYYSIFSEEFEKL